MTLIIFFIYSVSNVAFLRFSCSSLIRLVFDHLEESLFPLFSNANVVFLGNGFGCLRLS